jgi:hypothetical protein
MGGYTLDYSVIKRATKGEAEAIFNVLAHFEGYIKALSRTRVRDDRGSDIGLPPPEETENRLKAKLVLAIRKFDTERIRTV